MEYKEPKKRVTKNDKKKKGEVYSQKHIRNQLKQMEATKNKNASLHTPEPTTLKWTCLSMTKTIFLLSLVRLVRSSIGLLTNLDLITCGMTSGERSSSCGFLTIPM